MGGGVKLIETMSQNMQFFFWTASLNDQSQERSRMTLAEEFYDCAITPKYSYEICKLAFFKNLKAFSFV